MVEPAGRYSIDLVFCLDVSGNMRGRLDEVKEQVKRMTEQIAVAAKEMRKSVRSMRVRLIAFTDYLTGREAAVRLTDFYYFPEHKEYAWKELDSLEARGGFGSKKCGLEALAYGLSSKWETEGSVHRRLVALWTNGTTQGMNLSLPYYPKKMARSLEELAEWHKTRGKHTVILLFAPAEGAWKTMADTWSNVMFYPSTAGEGFNDREMKEIVDVFLEQD